MSEKRTIRVNRVVNTTSGQNNQTATTRTATAPRRVMRKRAGNRPAKYRQNQGQNQGQKPISIAIHNIFKPVNNFAPQGGKSRGFKRTGRKVPRHSMQTNRMQSPVRPRMMPSRSTMAVRPTGTKRPVRRTTTPRTSPNALRARRRSLKSNLRTIRAKKKFISANRKMVKANRKLTARKSIANKRVVLSNPFAMRRRNTPRIFGRKRR